MTIAEELQARKEHRMSWDGPFGRTYIENCSCGWSHFTFADSPESGIGVAHDAHVLNAIIAAKEAGV